MNVFVADEQAEPVDVSGLRHLATSVLEGEAYPADTEMSVILVNDEDMVGYHQRFLDGSGPTDVISLPIEELKPGHTPGGPSGGPPPMLGDVILAPSYIRRQASDLEQEFDDEMALMMVHGILHLLGYDHEDEADAVVMEEKERQILAAAGRVRR